HISPTMAVELVGRAKTNGINVTTKVCAYKLEHTDEEIEIRNYDTNIKMNTPMRTKKDTEEMSARKKDGTSEVICIDHAPHVIEEKEVEFIYAPNGIIGLQTAWSVSVRRLLQTGILELPDLLRKLVEKPREILNIDIPLIAEGEEANL